LGVGCKWTECEENSEGNEAVRASQWIWIRRSNSSWGPSRGSLRVNRLLGVARKLSRMYVSGGCGPCEPFENISVELACMALLAFLVIV